MSAVGENDARHQTPSTGLRHPSLGRCRKAMLGVWHVRHVCVVVGYERCERGEQYVDDKASGAPDTRPQVVSMRLPIYG